MLHSLIDELNVRKTIDILASKMRFQFSVFDLITQLVYARVISPCSKSKTASYVFLYLYGSSTISEDQVYDWCSFIGESYKKYIDLFNHSYERYYKRDLSNVFFDCTNYYFEIDIPSDDKQKGPSKENRHSPIIGQALLLDADLIPVSMQITKNINSFFAKRKRCRNLQTPQVSNILRFLIHRMTNRTFFIFTITHLVSLYAPAKDIRASTRPILLCQL